MSRVFILGEETSVVFAVECVIDFDELAGSISVDGCSAALGFCELSGVVERIGLGLFKSTHDFGVRHVPVLLPQLG